MRYGLDSVSSFGSLLEEEEVLDELEAKLSSSFINDEPPKATVTKVDPSPKSNGPRRKPSRMLPGGWYWSITGFEETPSSQEAATTGFHDDSDSDAPVIPIPERPRRPYTGLLQSDVHPTTTPTEDSQSTQSRASSQKCPRPMRRHSTLKQEDWRSSKPYPFKAQKRNPIRVQATMPTSTHAPHIASPPFRPSRTTVPLRQSHNSPPIPQQSSSTRRPAVEDDEAVKRSKEVESRRRAELEAQEARREAGRAEWERKQRRARLQKEKAEAEAEARNREREQREAELQEKLRQQQERAREEEERAEAQRWEELRRRARAQAKAAAAATSPRNVAEDSWALYQKRWAALAELQATNQPPHLYDPIPFSEVPWPIIRKVHITDEGQFPERITLADITPAAIREFLLSDAHSRGSSQKQRIRAATLLWHPDKFEFKVIPRVVSTDVEHVREGALCVIRALNSNFQG